MCSVIVIFFAILCISAVEAACLIQLFLISTTFDAISASCQRM